MKKIAGALAVAALLVGAAGCSSDSDDTSDYTQVCVDERTNERVPDDQCPRDYAGSSIYPNVIWWGYPSYVPMPGYGYPVPTTVHHYHYNQMPPGARTVARPPATGGTVTPPTARQQRTMANQQQTAQKRQAKAAQASAKASQPKSGGFGGTKPKSSQPKGGGFGGAAPKAPPAAPRPAPAPPRSR